MTHPLSRREFIKLSSSTLMGLGLLYSIPNIYANIQCKSNRLGRTTHSLRYYNQPSYSGKELGFYNTDAIVQIIEESIGDQEPTHNPIWYRTEKGWIHSAYVQPVENILNKPVMDIPPGGMLCEVTVPFTQAWNVDDDRRKRVYRFYYGSTHWITFAISDYDGSVWYRIVDDYYDASYIADAKHFRPVSTEDVVPISPDHLNKKIEINLAKQQMLAFENNHPVYLTQIATGYFEEIHQLVNLTSSANNLHGIW